MKSTYQGDACVYGLEPALTSHPRQCVVDISFQASFLTTDNQLALHPFMRPTVQSRLKISIDFTGTRSGALNICSV